MGKRNVYWVNEDRYKKQKANQHLYLNRERNQRFYHSKEWLKVTAFILGFSPICQACNYEIATETHHTININTPEGWKERLTLDYLESRCRTCHQRDTNREAYERKHGVSVKDVMDDLNNFE